MRAILTAAALSAVALLATGCGDDRSPEAYCKAFYSKAAPIRQNYVDANQRAKRSDADMLSSIVTLLQAPGDLVAIFDGMVDHAPDAIKSDTVQVRDALKKLQDGMGDALSNPLKALGANLIASMTSAGSFNRVDAYLGQHCPVDSELAQRYIQDASDGGS
jgi:hypothetical protein